MQGLISKRRNSNAQNVSACAAACPAARVDSSSVNSVVYDSDLCFIAAVDCLFLYTVFVYCFLLLLLDSAAVDAAAAAGDVVDDNADAAAGDVVDGFSQRLLNPPNCF